MNTQNSELRSAYDWTSSSCHDCSPPHTSNGVTFLTDGSVKCIVGTVVFLLPLQQANRPKYR